MKRLLGALFLSLFLWAGFCPAVFAKEPLKITDVESSGGSSNQMNVNVSTKRYASVMKSYVYSDNDDSFTILDASTGTVYLDTYSKSDGSLTSSREIPFELNLFGGFYAGKEYNFIVFGQTNEEEDDTLPTFKTVKYSKNWEKLGEADYCANNTVIPFDAGSLRMAEYNGYLYVRSSHEMYTSDDGLNHQANITYSVNIEQMTVADEYSKVMNVNYGYVSHSFNQFIKIDNGKLVCVDHGDAYPRSIVLGTYNSNLQDGVFTGSYTNVDLFNIPGDTGANCTGITIGGFESSSDNYLVAINSIDHSKVTSYTSFEMEGLELDERDIVLLISEKENTSTDSVKNVYLTDYVDQYKLGSTPYLVKLTDNRFMVLWEEYSYVEYEDDPGDYYTKSNGLRYAYVDGSGTLLSGIMSASDAHLAADCQPVYVGEDVIWYTNDGNGGRKVYSLSANENTENTENPFTDISDSDYYYDAVLWAYENGITSGIDATHFAPHQECTRGQVVTFLWRAKGKPQATETDHPFVDLNTEAYYYEAVLWAYENNIVNGIDSTHFAPNETVTRGQFAAFLHRAEGEPAYTTENPFTDISDSDYYYNAVLWAYENGITEGTDATHFAPQKTCTRGEAVTFLYRAFN